MKNELSLYNRLLQIGREIDRQQLNDQLKISGSPLLSNALFGRGERQGRYGMRLSTVTLGRMKESTFQHIRGSTGLIVTKASNIRSFSDMAGRELPLSPAQQMSRPSLRG